MKFTKQDRKFMLDNFYDAVDKLYPQTDVIDANLSNRFYYKGQASNIVDGYIDFINKQSADERDAYFRNIEVRDDKADKVKALLYIQDAIEIFKIKLVGNICRLSNNGKIEKHEDNLPNVDYKDDDDIPEADFS